VAKGNVSVVIPSWNGADFVARSLECLVALPEEPEILVVDHGRLNRDTERVVTKFAGRVRYVGEDEQLGYAGAVNRGVSLASHPLVAVICNDVLVHQHWLRELLVAYKKFSEEGKHPVLSASVHRDELPDPRRARTNLWFRVVRPVDAPLSEVLFHPDGSSFLFDKSFYGLPFDDEYFLYQEDVYFGWRVQLLGQEVRLVPTATAGNFDGGTTRRTPYRTSFLTERNRWLNYFSFLSGSSLLRALPALTIDFLVKLVAGKNARAKLHALAWLAVNPRWIWAKRRRCQAERLAGDEQALALLSATYLDGSDGLNRLFALLLRACGLKISP
jgi:GT2 family glycosyltransferase